MRDLWRILERRKHPRVRRLHQLLLECFPSAFHTSLTPSDGEEEQTSQHVGGSAFLACDRASLGVYPSLSCRARLHCWQQRAGVAGGLGVVPVLRGDQQVEAESEAQSPARMGLPKQQSNARGGGSDPQLEGVEPGGQRSADVRSSPARRRAASSPQERRRAVHREARGRDPGEGDQTDDGSIRRVLEGEEEAGGTAVHHEPSPAAGQEV
mmetsp:Transcript_17600/g.58001  ORF Transcript_17600/g.58001 Transcript_17600/m.58001 type:complete len:210 (-) Transcript_17600:559-1188(-)